MNPSRAMKGSFRDNASNSVSAVLEPAGLESSIGVVTGLYLKHPNHTRWANDPAVGDFLGWMKKYQRNANIGDLFNVHVGTVAEVMESPA